MKTIYIVFGQQDYGSTYILGIYSKKESAEAALLEEKEKDKFEYFPFDNIDIMVMKLNVPLKEMII